MERIMTNTQPGPLDELDASILGRLAALFESMDPPPERLNSDVAFALSLAALDAELATLQHDTSLLLRAQPATAPDTVTFTSSSVQLMVSVSDDGDDALRVDGWVTGGGIVVELVQDGSRIAETSDVHGRLTWHGVARGRSRFLIHPGLPETRSVLTPVIEF